MRKSIFLFLCILMGLQIMFSGCGGTRYYQHNGHLYPVHPSITLPASGPPSGTLVDYWYHTKKTWEEALIDWNECQLMKGAKEAKCMMDKGYISTYSPAPSSVPIGVGVGIIVPVK